MSTEGMQNRLFCEWAGRQFIHSKWTQSKQKWLFAISFSAQTVWPMQNKCICYLWLVTYRFSGVMELLDRIFQDISLSACLGGPGAPRKVLSWDDFYSPGSYKSVLSCLWGEQLIQESHWLLKRSLMKDIILRAFLSPENTIKAWKESCSFLLSRWIWYMHNCMHTNWKRSEI